MEENIVYISKIRSSFFSNERTIYLWCHCGINVRCDSREKSCSGVCSCLIFKIYLHYICTVPFLTFLAFEIWLFQQLSVASTVKDSCIK